MGGVDLKCRPAVLSGLTGRHTAALAAAEPSLMGRDLLLQVFVKARQKLGEILSAFEFFDQQALDLTLKHLEGVRNPLPDTQTPIYLVVETSGSNEEHDNEKLQASPTPFHILPPALSQLQCSQQALSLTSHTYDVCQGYIMR